MGLLLDAAKLEKAFRLVKDNPGDQTKVGDLVEIVKPIIALTRDRFPQHMGEDLEQEIRMFLLRRAEYLAKAYFGGKIKNPTNYLFTVCRNAAMNHMKRELKNDDRLIPLEDAKSEPIWKGPRHQKTAVVDHIREKMLDWCKIRYKDQPRLVKRAQKFVMALMDGQRPSFHDAKLEKFAESEGQVAKDVYSVVLLKMRELTAQYLDTLLG